MNEVRLLEAKFGGWWCGVKFGKDAGVQSRRPARPMRFCEAVAASRTGLIALTPDLLNCPGGSRSLGWNTDEEIITQTMAEKLGLDTEVAAEVLRATPRLEDRVDEVTIGTYDEPDVVISYSQPEAAMGLLHAWQRKHGRPLALETSGFMSVCGAVAVKAFLTGRICISFGCPDAREHGSIGRDRLVVGLPMREASDLVRRPRSAEAEAAPMPSAVRDLATVEPRVP